MFNNIPGLASMLGNQLGVGAAPNGTAASAGVSPVLDNPALAKKKKKAQAPDWPSMLGGMNGGAANPMALLMMALMGQDLGK